MSGILKKYKSAIDLNGGQPVNFVQNQDGTMEVRSMTPAATPPVQTGTVVPDGQQDGNAVTKPDIKPSTTAVMPTTTLTGVTGISAGTDAMTHFTQILGKSPEEKAAEEEKLRRASLSRQAVMRFFDGLRYLGYSAGFRPTPAVKFSDTSAIAAQNYQDERAQRQRVDAESAAYKMKIYEMQQAERQRQRQAAQDERQARLDAINEEERQRAHTEAEEVKKYNRERQAAIDKQNNELHQARLDKEKAQKAYIETQTKYLANKPYSAGGRGGGRSTKVDWIAELNKDIAKYGVGDTRLSKITTQARAQVELGRRINNRQGNSSGSGGNGYAGKFGG